MFKTSTQKNNNNKTVIYLYDHNEIAKCQIPPYIVKLTPFLLGHRVAFFKVQSVLIPQDILTTTLLSSPLVIDTGRYFVPLSPYSGNRCIHLNYNE